MTETLANRRVFRSKVDTIRPTYGFEDVSLAPGTDTVDPADVVLAQSFCGIDLEIPVLAAAMDAVADVRLSGELARLGGLVDPQPRGRPVPLRRPGRGPRRGSPPRPTTRSRTSSPRPTAPPIREELIARRIEELHAAGSKAAVSATPGIARKFGPFCAEHGADLFLVQSQVSSARHLATGYEPLALAEFTRFMPIPVAVGNTTNARGRVPAHGAGRRGDLRRRRAGRGVHDARGAGHRHPAGHRHRRRRRGARPVPRRDRALRARSSPTAA